MLQSLSQLVRSFRQLITTKRRTRNLVGAKDAGYTECLANSVRLKDPRCVDDNERKLLLVKRKS